MKIGIDISEAKKEKRTGIGNYAFLLAEHLRTILPPGDELIKMLPGRGLPFWNSHVSFAKKIRKAKLDVWHGTANVLPMGLKGGKGSKENTKLVITIHDLAIYKHPEWFARGQWFATKVVVPRSIKIADHIIVPSEPTRKDLLELFGVADTKITVIPLGVEPRFFTRNFHEFRGAEREASIYEFPEATRKKMKLIEINRNLLSKKYILFVGTLEPRKNITRLIEAYHTLPEDILEGYELVVAGDPSPLSPPTSGEGKGGGRIKLLDYVPDEDLPALYQNASLFVYPSLYEGFGLPILEAMAAGVPVVTSHQVASNIPGFPGEAVNPLSVDEIRNAIIKYLSPPREYARGTLSSSGESNNVAALSSRDVAYASQISKAGQELARQFTWERTAKQTLEIYRNTIEMQ
ncbi:MAG: glycosyltransferase family 4 protein [Candidatus Doudnabacteria bacterium]|nr:glycosyltransferase family 4 protein [Candidatus Doudnabacteria bacterium]